MWTGELSKPIGVERRERRVSRLSVEILAVNMVLLVTEEGALGNDELATSPSSTLRSSGILHLQWR